MIKLSFQIRIGKINTQYVVSGEMVSHLGVRRAESIRHTENKFHVTRRSLCRKMTPLKSQQFTAKELPSSSWRGKKARIKSAV